MRYAVTFALIGTLMATIALSFAALFTGHSPSAVLAATSLVMSPLCALVGVAVGATMRRP